MFKKMVNGKLNVQLMFSIIKLTSTTHSITVMINKLPIYRQTFHSIHLNSLMILNNVILLFTFH